MCELKTKPGVTIALDVVMDNANVDGNHALAISVAGTGIVRYVNGRVDEGSVSLLGHSSNFEVVTELEMVIATRIGASLRRAGQPRKK